MPFNGSGVFQRLRNWVADATAGIKIRADYHDAEDDGFAAGLTNCITKDGQTVITQNIPMNSKRITGLADPVNPQDAATKASLTSAIVGFVKKVGDTMTGDLVIDKANPSFILDKTGAGGTAVWGRTDGKNRWVLQPGDSGTESTGNIGSDFGITRYDDAGGSLGRVLTINRATGLGTVFGDPTAALGIATKQYVDTKDATFQPKDPQLFAGIPLVANPGTTNATHAQKCIRGIGTVTLASGGVHPSGTVISFYAEGGTLTINSAENITWFSPSGGTIATSRTLGDRGVATVLRIDTHWVIAGNGLT